jgi:chromosome segregation ATPase
MGVDGVSQFKKAMEESQGAVKNLDAELKLSEAQYRATGDAETYLQTKTSLLTKQIQEQKNVVKQAEQALQAMKDKGVSETSASFQKMEGNLIKAKTKLTDMETALKNVDSEAKTAGDSLQGIGKNVAWDTVAEGLGKITDKLQSAGRTALRLGKTIAKSAMDSTEWADDILTRATQYGIDAETLQRMENVADYIDTDVDTIIAARDRLSKNRKSLGELLGIESDGKSVDDVFWEAGEAIMNLGDEFDKTEISADTDNLEFIDLPAESKYH